MRFGGWGIRSNVQQEIAYNISGKHGIELQLKSYTIVVGTQNPDELLKAINLEL